MAHKIMKFCLTKGNTSLSGQLLRQKENIYSYLTKSSPKEYQINLYGNYGLHWPWDSAYQMAGYVVPLNMICYLFIVATL